MRNRFRLRTATLGAALAAAAALLPTPPAAATIYEGVGYAYSNYNDVYARANTISAWMNKDTGAHKVRAYARNTEFSNQTLFYLSSWLTSCTGTGWCGLYGSWVGAATSPMSGYYDVTNYTPTWTCAGGVYRSDAHSVSYFGSSRIDAFQVSGYIQSYCT